MNTPQINTSHTYDQPVYDHSSYDHSSRIEKMLENRHRQFLWTKFVIIALGLWLLSNIPTFGSQHLASRICDVASGIMLIALGFISLNKNKVWAPWAVSLVGVWMQLYPLLFKAPTSYEYMNDTVIGLLAILFSLVIPGIPGILDGSIRMPQGWSYNPSAWSQRLPIAALAFFGWIFTRYMAAFQLGYIHTIYDPLFPNGTYTVMTSNFSKVFPISYAGLGAVSYSLIMLMACIGGQQRYRTMPWFVTLFGVFVVPVGLISIILALSHPLIAGSWCSWCLASAFIMLAMIAMAIDEVWATYSFLKAGLREGESFTDLFWHGDKVTETELDELETSSQKDDEIIGLYVTSLKRGVSLPWNLVLSALLGVWLMIIPDLFVIPESLISIDRVIGSFITVVSFISFAEVARTVRFCNIILGAILAGLVWYLTGFEPLTIQNPQVFIAISALAVVLLAFRKGPIHERYESQPNEKNEPDPKY